jgi:DNA-binding MarR family transcriptional regulator
VKLEEEIKQQKPFVNELEKLFVNILYTASWIDGKNIQRLKVYGLSPQQYNVLRILRGAQPNASSLGYIASRMIDKNSNATRLVEKLRQKGFVEREVCLDNRRQVDIHITPSGLDILSRIDNEAENWLEKFNTLSKDELLIINLLLDKTRDI